MTFLLEVYGNYEGKRLPDKLFTLAAYQDFLKSPNKYYTDFGVDLPD